MAIKLIGSGIMSALIAQLFQTESTTSKVRSYGALQYNFITRQRAAWLRHHRLLPPILSPVQSMLLFTQDTQMTLSHPQGLGYILAQQHWMDYLCEKTPSPRSLQGHGTWIAAGSQPEMHLPPLIKTDIRPSHQHIWISHIQHEHPHQQRACQTFDPSGITASLPLVSPHESLILSTQTLNTLDAPSFPSTLQRLWGSHQLIAQTPKQALKSVFRYPAHAHTVLLLGDSRMTIHPLAGLGLNAGLYALEDLYQRLETSPLFDEHLAYAHARTTQHHLHRLYLLTQSLAHAPSSLLCRQGLAWFFHTLETYPILKTTAIQLADPWTQGHQNP